MGYRQPERWYVRDEMGPGEVVPWPQVEEALQEAGITEDEWSEGIREGKTYLGPYVDVPFLFWWREGKLVAGRTERGPFIIDSDCDQGGQHHLVKVDGRIKCDRCDRFLPTAKAAGYRP